MAIPDDVRSPVHWVFMGLLAVLAWFGKREVRRIEMDMKENKSNISELQKDRVTRKDFDELRSSMVATIAHGFDRLEDQVQTRHDENRSSLAAIQSRIDQLWARE